MVDLLKKIGRGVKVSISVVKESIASPRARAVYKETWMGAKEITKYPKKGNKKQGLNFPSVFEPSYVAQTIKKARKRKRKK